jgi:TPR repeat protein
MNRHLPFFLALSFVLSACSKPAPTDPVDSLLSNARNGGAQSQMLLARRYADGDGVEQSFKHSEFWYRVAAEGGDLQAALRLATMILEGKGVRQDPEDAFRWFKRAADGGARRAWFYLGQCHLEGLGTAKSEIEAYAWLRMAMDDGDHRAKGAIHELRNTLKPYHVQAGDRRVATLREQFAAQ